VPAQATLIVQYLGLWGEVNLELYT